MHPRDAPTTPGKSAAMVRGAAALDRKVAAPLPRETLRCWSSPAGCCARQPADLANSIRLGLRWASDIGY
jgi:hypothetical protein